MSNPQTPHETMTRDQIETIVRAGLVKLNVFANQGCPMTSREAAYFADALSVLADQVARVFIETDYSRWTA